MTELQTRVGQWLEQALGRAVATDPRERALRLVEESVELAQVVGVEAGVLAMIIGHVYGRPMGVARQEISGCMMTVLAAAEALGIDAEGALREELDRVETPEMIAKVRCKHQAKFDAGISIKRPDLPQR